MLGRAHLCTFSSSSARKDHKTFSFPKKEVNRSLIGGAAGILLLRKRGFLIPTDIFHKEYHPGCIITNLGGKYLQRSLLKGDLNCKN